MPAQQAAIALARADAKSAVADLQKAAPYELGGGILPFTAGATMYPVYLRGQAYLQMREWSNAAVEFQKIIEHRGLVWNFPLGALAHVQLARSFTSSDPGRAQSEYQTFLTLWQDADRNLRLLSESQSEYARLKSAP